MPFSIGRGHHASFVKARQLNWEVASAGTGDWHIGQTPDKRSIAIAKKYGYDISGQKARHFIPELFEQFDHILVMDKNNLKYVLRLAKNDEQRKKVALFLADEEEVTDPYYDDALFDPVFKEVEARCKDLISNWEKK